MAQTCWLRKLFDFDRDGILHPTQQCFAYLCKVIMIDHEEVESMIPSHVRVHAGKHQVDLTNSFYSNFCILKNCVAQGRDKKCRLQSAKKSTVWSMVDIDR